MVSEGSFKSDFRFDGAIVVVRLIPSSLNICNMLRPSLRYVKIYVPYEPGVLLFYCNLVWFTFDIHLPNALSISQALFFRNISLPMFLCIQWNTTLWQRTYKCIVRSLSQKLTNNLIVTRASQNLVLIQTFDKEVNSVVYKLCIIHSVFVGVRKQNPRVHTNFSKRILRTI